MRGLWRGIIEKSWAGRWTNWMLCLLYASQGEDGQYRLINLLKSLILTTLRTLWRILGQDLYLQRLVGIQLLNQRVTGREFISLPDWEIQKKATTLSSSVLNCQDFLDFSKADYCVFLFLRNQSVLVTWLSSCSPSVSGYNWAGQTQRHPLGLLLCLDIPFPYPFTPTFFPPQEPYILSLF